MTVERTKTETVDINTDWYSLFCCKWNIDENLDLWKSSITFEKFQFQTKDSILPFLTLPYRCRFLYMVQRILGFLNFIYDIYLNNIQSVYKY